MNNSLLNGIPFIIGCILLYTSCSKANFSKPFYLHLLRSGISSTHFASILVLLIVAIEAVCALLLLFAPQFPLSITLTLTLFSIFTISSLINKTRGNTNSCSCYGLMLPLTVDESIRFNIVYMLSLMMYRIDVISPMINLSDNLVIGIGLSTILFVFCTSRSLQSPFFNFSPMKTGRKLPKVLKTYFTPLETDYILAFMNPDCEDCIKWLKKLKDFHKEEIKIIVLVSKESSKNQIFYKYPTYIVKPLHYFWLIFESPSLFYIKSSTISQKISFDDSIESLFG